MTHRILKLFRWQIRFSIPLWGQDSIVWRRDGYLGITINEIWGCSLTGKKAPAKLSLAGSTLCHGIATVPYNTHYLYATMRTSQFHLTSDSPIAFTSFSWWKGDSP